MDLDLADATAWEFLSDVRSRKCTPVLTLSMLRSERHAVAALESGADDYIIKPFGLDELVAQQADTISHIVPGVNARELHVTAFRSSLSVPRYPSGSGPNR